MIAFISVSDKAGVQEFARELAELGFEIYSTGGTQRALAEAGLSVRGISSLTGFPEILGGRIKSIHPILYGGVLARRDLPEHMDDLRRNDIPPIDLVCVNLYPFVETVASGAAHDECLEQIDIGGPAIIRAAAKNYPFVLVLVDPADYAGALDRLRADARPSGRTGDGAADNVPLEFRRRLAEKAFQHTAHYDTAIVQYLRADARPRTGARLGPSGRGEEAFPERMTLAFDKALDLRYGENPHQRAALYREERVGAPAGGIVAAEKLHGLDLSYINVMDADAAWQAVMEFDDPSVVIVKHASPCGIASHEEIAEAYRRAFESDPVSPFGGIIAANRPVTESMVAAMKGMRYDVIVAPDYEPAALQRLQKRRDLRILRADIRPRAGARLGPSGRLPEGPALSEVEGAPAADLDYRRVTGGLLVQDADRCPDDRLELRVVTKRAPTAGELADLRFAWKVVKHVKSNAIVVAKDGATVGIGGGQQNRKTPVELALRLAGEKAKGAVLASDAFFPFARDDAVEMACRAGVTAIIQPGGAVRDEEAVEVCDEYGVAMVFSGERHFRH
ncbi:MAG: bifunctional phosphoribosylaminoimidazolecarboxamide formyltransferase/IMP cyclohydrolase [Chloroflexi bacterium]|nr:bifunctional phosphoribosylaminoimidazolecarboxamide formyltransferase/IMP cyclohydrolase [Chloroflexota bacterium]